MSFMTFHILGIIIPTDELHHFSEGLKAPTRDGLWLFYQWSSSLWDRSPGRWSGRLEPSGPCSGDQVIGQECWSPKDQRHQRGTWKHGKTMGKHGKKHGKTLETNGNHMRFEPSKQGQLRKTWGFHQKWGFQPRNTGIYPGTLGMGILRAERSQWRKNGNFSVV